jgi:hypothetical protein
MEETIQLFPESDETIVPVTRENIIVNPGGTSDFNELENRPQYNSQEMTGETNIPVIPTKVSELDNDSEFQTGSQVESSISSAIAGKQDTLTAGTNISIVDNTISATDTTYTAGANITIDSDNKISATDTTYSNFTGTDGQTAGAAGLVPAPATTDTDKFLKSDGTWDTAGGGSSVNVVQTTGTSTTDVMSQNATTSMIFDDSATQANIKIGNGATIGPNLTTNNQVSIGKNATIAGKGSDIAIGAYSSISNKANTRAIAIGGSVHKDNSIAIGGTVPNGASDNNIAIGFSASPGGSSHTYSVALGNLAECKRSGEVNVGTGGSSVGFNSTKYRVIGGVHDGQDANDAATVGQINATIDAINTALNTNIPHVGAST